MRGTVAKRLRRIATKLPKNIQVIRRSTKENIKGETLLKMGVMKTRDGKPVLENNNYVKNVPVKQAVNHVRQLKRMYMQHGSGAVEIYCNAIIEHVINMNAPKA